MPQIEEDAIIILVSNDKVAHATRPIAAQLTESGQDTWNQFSRQSAAGQLLPTQRLQTAPQRFTYHAATAGRCVGIACDHAHAAVPLVSA